MNDFVFIQLVMFAYSCLQLSELWFFDFIMNMYVHVRTCLLYVHVRVHIQVYMYYLVAGWLCVSAGGAPDVGYTTGGVPAHLILH